MGVCAQRGYHHHFHGVQQRGVRGNAQAAGRQVSQLHLQGDYAQMT
jgi:hypothetical protein